MNQMTLYKRPEAEQRINAALEKLYPDGEVTGTMLSRYTPWEDVKDIPLMEMGRVCSQLEKEPGFLAFLGENKYFDTVTAGMKIALYQAALDKMEEALAAIGYKRDDGITFERFRAVWNLCIKECRFPPQNKKASCAYNKRKNEQKTSKKRDQKISNNDITAVKQVISFLNKNTGRSFRTTSKKNQEHVLARLNEGYTLEDFKKVIAGRCAKWNHRPEAGEKDMRDYLRPETLFGSKFESYLNAVPEGVRENPMDTEEYVPLKRRGGIDKNGEEHTR